MISTHTLTWSVTRRLDACAACQPNFNSHAHVERDKMTYKKAYEVLNFNSHAHVERDMYLLQHTLESIHFNSHAHVERDGHSVPMDKLAPISTHTLTWSVTLRRMASVR